MAITAGTNFAPEVVSEIFSKVRGKSSVAKLAPQMPIAFSGSDVFVFSTTGSVHLVGENAEKPAGVGTIAPITIRPLKVVYQERVSDEFMHCAEEKQLGLLSAFADNAAALIAKGLDAMAIHGYAPGTTQVSSLISSYIDQTTNKVVAAAPTGADIATAIAMVTDYDVDGIAMSKACAASLYATQGDKNTFDALAWGGQPETLLGLNADINNTVSSDMAIVGDFSAFRWGYADDMSIEVIEYGDPDNAGADLKGHNQVMLRAEAYIGFAVLDTNAFAKVTTA